MGDCIHQRAILRQLMQAHDVWLETSWASLYHDLVPDGLKLLPRPVRLRTQTKNANRERLKFFEGGPPRGHETLSVQYGRGSIGACASHTVLEAMCRAAGCDYATADYRLPIPAEWTAQLAERFINTSGKPLMVYRPLVKRPEWGGSALRNADPAGYMELLAEIRDTFFVVSVADLQATAEWIVGPEFQADATFHKGELHFEMLAALFAQADLVFTSSGFAAILAPAVETPVVSVIGGYESAVWHSAGAKFAPYLGIDPVHPCQCGTSMCRQGCDKTLDIPAAKARLRQFVSEQGVRILPQTSGTATVAATAIAEQKTAGLRA